MRAFALAITLAMPPCALVSREEEPPPVVTRDDAAVATDTAPACDAGPVIESGVCELKIVASSRASIGSAGGTLKLVGGWEPTGVPFTITIPPGALDATHEFVVTELKNDAPPCVGPASPIYRVEPSGVRFDRPASIMVTWPPGVTSVAPGGLVVYAAPNEGVPFTAIPDSYINAGFLNASLTETAFVFAGAATFSQPRALCP
jgi:hypothetical protein